MSIKSVAVFCGSKDGKNTLYVQHAKELANLLVQKNITVVYGGGRKGIMGALANAVLEKKGNIIGVIPKVLMESEQQHSGLTELHEAANMHSRKAMLYNKCDTAIVLPGGYGTMDEFFEIITWNQLNIHDKRIIILNSGGFYHHLIMHLKKMQEEGFLHKDLMDVITIASSPQEINL